MGLAAVQFIDNLGNPLTNGALYVYQSGTSTQASTFSDSQCTVPNTNPVTFTTGGRATIWVNTSGFFKYVLCQVSTDGPACSGGDQLFTIDNVPGGVTGGSGGGASAPFITNSANPATTGILRLASGDAICWRNTANSANLCFTKDTSDLLSWGGGSIKLPEVGTPTSVTGFDILNPNSTAHRFEQCSNGVACTQLVNAGNDISTNDAVTALHFNTTQTPIGSTAPTTNQALVWNGTNIVGGGEYNLQNDPGITFSNGTALCTPSTILTCTYATYASAHTLIRFMYTVSNAPSGCSTQPGIGVRDITAGSNIFNTTVANGAATGSVDSGALSLAMPAGHEYAVGITQSPAGCAVQLIVFHMVAIYQ